MTCWCLPDRAEPTRRLKIYQYLRSGTPIVATRLLTHTQVLTDETAILTGASAMEFGEGIPRGAQKQRTRGRAWVSTPARLAETSYSYEAYLERTRQAYDMLLERASASRLIDATDSARALSRDGEGLPARSHLAPRE